MRRVVITGMAPVGANGIGKEAFFHSLFQKEIKLKEVPREYEQHYQFKSRFFVPKPELPDLDFSPAMEEMSRIGVVSARLALEDAQLTEVSRAGVIVGVGMGSLKTGLESHQAHVSGEGRFNRMVIPMLMPNSVAAWIAIDTKAQGMCYTVNAACASGAAAIGAAYTHIRHGNLNCAITGGVECMEDGTGSIMRGFDSLTALTRSKTGYPMPFSRKRSGFLFSMGAGCILILEEYESAKRRGADIYAEIIDYQCNCDAFSIVQIAADGRQMEALFEKAKELPIDYVNTHGTGTVQNDEIESDMLKRVFGKKLPLMNATKGLIGHSIGASAAIEAAVTAYAVKHNMIHGNITEDTIDGLNLPPDTTEAEITCALTTAYGFGGHNTLILMRKCDG